jgi:hypothetical protein
MIQRQGLSIDGDTPERNQLRIGQAVLQREARAGSRVLEAAYRVKLLEQRRRNHLLPAPIVWDQTVSGNQNLRYYDHLYVKLLTGTCNFGRNIVK